MYLSFYLLSIISIRLISYNISFTIVFNGMYSLILTFKLFPISPFEYRSWYTWRLNKLTGFLDVRTIKIFQKFILKSFYKWLRSFRRHNLMTAYGETALGRMVSRDRRWTNVLRGIPGSLSVDTHKTEWVVYLFEEIPTLTIGIKNTERLLYQVIMRWQHRFQ